MYMNSNIERAETQPVEDQESPLKVVTQNAPLNWITPLSQNDELELLAQVDLATAREHANESTDFDTINFKMASASMKTAGETGADVLFLTDQKQQKLGIAARKSPEGLFQLLTANQIALIVAETLLEQREGQGEEDNPLLIIRSVISSDVLDVQAAHWQARSTQTYPGLEALSQAMEEQEGYQVLLAVDEQNHFVFPGLTPEESLLKAMFLVSEKAKSLKKEGETLVDFLLMLFKRYGFYQEKSFGIKKEDKHGQKQIEKSMRALRQQPLDALFGQPVRTLIDFQKKTYLNLLTGKKAKTDLPKADLLQFYFTDNSRVTFETNEDYSKIIYHISIKDRLISKENFEEVRNASNERMIRMMEKVGKF